MTSYRSLWVRTWAVAALLSIGLAAVMWGPGRVLALFGLVGVTSAALGICFYRDPGHTHLSGAEVRRSVVKVAVIGGASAVAVMALIDVNGPLAMLALLLMGATSPWAVGFLRKKLGRTKLVLAPPVESLAADEPQRPSRDVSGMSDRELCRAWRASFAALVDAVDPRTKCTVVRLRQSYLDELERRHPDAVEAWLASHPRPGGGPEKFLGADDDRDAA